MIGVSPSLGLPVTATGAAAQVLGLALDGWLHQRNPDLARTESVFSLSNGGHVLLLGGIVLVCAGVAAQWAGSRTFAAPASRARRLLRGTAVAGAALLLSGTTAATATMMAAESNDHRAVRHAAPTPSPSAGGHASSHGNRPSIPALDEATRALLDLQLASARDTATRYARLGDALADGFFLATTYEPLIGSHYLRYPDVDHTFDVGRPEMLLYDGDTPDSRIVGLSYYVIGPVPPVGFAGRADDWHQHRDTCLTANGPVFAGDGYRQCRASGRLSWMLHAWVVPGWESPQGVFSDENARLR